MTGLVLRPYQQTGVTWLTSKGRALLGDDPGLGKTAQAIVAAEQQQARRVLVICPAHLRSNWRAELAKTWAGPYRCVTDTSPAVIKDALLTKLPLWLVLSYEAVVQLQHFLAVYNFDVIIADEAHYLKNPESGRTRAVIGDSVVRTVGLRDRAAMFWWLTGTPMMNDPSELWASAYSCGVTNLSYADWCRTFCRYVWTPKYGERIVGAQNEDLLKGGLARYVLRRRKRDVLTDLPPLSIEPLALDVDTAVLRVLAKTRRNFTPPPEGASDDEVLAWFKENELHYAEYHRKCGVGKAGAAARWVNDFLLGGEQIVVVAQHLDVLEMMASLIPGAALMTGRASADARKRIVDNFQAGNIRVILGQMQAMGTGYTMTAASTMLIVEASPVPGNNVQAIGRIERIGQRHPMTVYMAHAAQTSDELVARAIRRKTKMIAGLNLE